jgi:hypothetical protein
MLDTYSILGRATGFVREARRAGSRLAKTAVDRPVTYLRPPPYQWDVNVGWIVRSGCIVSDLVEEMRRRMSN